MPFALLTTVDNKPFSEEEKKQQKNVKLYREFNKIQKFSMNSIIELRAHLLALNVITRKRFQFNSSIVLNTFTPNIALSLFSDVAFHLLFGDMQICAKNESEF